MAADTPSTRLARHRPRTATVFVAAFVAGAAAAVGVNRALDVHLAQAKPQVECEPIFVALRALPSGAPVTVWDVALRDLPKAMVPATALRVTDSFAGRILKFPLREGQPLVSGQLGQPEPAAPAAAEVPAAGPVIREDLVEEAFIAPLPAAPPVAAGAAEPAIGPRDVAVRQPAFDDAEPDTTDTTEIAVRPTGAADREPTVANAAATAAAALVAGTDHTAVEAPPAVANAQPTPATVLEPTPAETAGESAHVAAPQPESDQQAAVVTRQPASPAGEPRPSNADALDMPSRPPVDVSNLPSVIARDTAPIAIVEGTATRSGVRYLVVPERIARQADTSFTTPAAPSTGLVEPDAQGAALVPQPAATQPEPPARQPRQPRAQGAKSQPRPAQGGTSPASQPDARQSARDKQSGQQQARSGATAQPNLAEQQSADGRQPSPRAWGGMFPNVSAGLEAMGGWRSSRTTSDQSAPGSTTR